MIVNDKFILYQDNLGSFPIGLIAKYFIKKSPEYNPDKVKVVNLIQPELQRLLKNDKRAEIVEWNIFDNWDREQVDFIKVANVLKPNVFSDEEIIQALKNLKNILKPNGYLMIIKNEEIEKYSLFKLDDGSFKLISEKNSGCDITKIINPSIVNYNYEYFAHYREIT